VIEGDVQQVTAREIEIIDSLVHGATAREIARQLDISFHTVRTHIRNIYLKVGVANRIELLRWRDASLLAGSRSGALEPESSISSRL
jgi:DNA-binding CsgD family transcriptional regulator